MLLVRSTIIITTSIIITSIIVVIIISSSSSSVIMYTSTYAYTYTHTSMTYIQYADNIRGLSHTYTRHALQTWRPPALV